MAAPGKQYGLILPKKLLQRNVCLPKHAAFADDSDDETSVGESLQKEALKKRVMKQTKLEIQKALEEDSSVYDYDNVYDDLQKKKEENNAKQLAGKDKKPKYIQNILKAVEVRKKEQEKRMEKKIQKEREMEGQEFEDKEAFVTSAYKKRLQEKAEEEEQERREAEMEASLDVTKQKDLSGFYRHLLNQTVGEEETPECSLRNTGVKQEKSRGYSDEANQDNRDDVPVQASNVKVEENIDADSNLGSDSSGEEDITDKESIAVRDKKDQCKGKGDSAKSLKKHRHSDSSSEETDELLDQKKREKGSSDMGRVEKDMYQKQRDYDRHYEDKKQHGEHNSKDRHRQREEQDYRPRDRERKENESSNKDRRRERDREYSDKDRQRNGKDERSERERARRNRDKEEEENKQDRTDKEKHRPKDRGDRTDKDKKTRDTKEKSPPVSERPEKTQPEISDDKRKVEETQKEEVANSKFAKRSNLESVGSARDRYLARQMARIGTKAYVEKEED
ncbi:nuclear speckle splicing regulatory protein 1 [Pelodytes ibericus]